MRFRTPGHPPRLGIPVALALSGALAVGAGMLPVAARGAPHPWAPPPVNSCGETGFDPLLRESPEPAPEPAPAQPDPTVRITVPAPSFLPVPVPGPRPDGTRIDPAPLPANPCDNPCPDIRDSPKPAPATTTPETTAPEANPGEPAEPATTTTAAPATPPGLFPDIEITPRTETVPIPYPGGDPPEPQPGPAVEPQPWEAGPAAAPGPVPEVESVELVEQLTGHGSANRTDMRWSVDGTDLGLIYETGPGQVALVFGDTFGKGWEPPGAGTGEQDWRSNTLAYSTDRNLADGLTLDTFVQDSRCHAAEILDSRKIENFEVTTIPTSGFTLGSRQYLTYMSVNAWSSRPGAWVTNRGGLAWSDDNGRTWTKSQWAQWDNLLGLARFQVSAMVPHGDYVYLFGTPNGRYGTLGLGRVRSEQVLNKSAYQYWIGNTWVSADGPTEMLVSPLVSGPVGEVSIRYDAASGEWQMTYLDVNRHQIVLRTAAEPQGAWSEPVPLIDTDDYPSAYGGFIHPWSTSKDLYLTMSAWNSYNVYLVHVALK
ncbi:DUF4185 domain-containing protein [Nocardia inohanensis]|uniref:DUF4185 domain-containing protein n=1 Tax=Nocardia inohanensis TaxID=209246 RepID=UPI000832865A|nr:DUF4185 domain-containing protein [Nocardia inohanensis]